MATTDPKTETMRELLPWHLNGTLDEAESASVRRELEGNAELQAEAEQTERLLKTLADEEPVPMLTHDRIAGVLARLDSEPQESPRMAARLARLRRWLRDVPSRRNHWVPVVMATALGLVAILVVLPQPTPDTDPYRTLYGDRPAVPIEVRLAGNLGESEARALFRTYSLTAERQQDGGFVVSLPAETSPGELLRVLQTLRADGRIADARVMTEEE